VFCQASTCLLWPLTCRIPHRYALTSRCSVHSITFQRLALHWVHREESERLESAIQDQIDLEDTSVRLQRYIEVEGGSGAGKTRVGTHVVAIILARNSTCTATFIRLDPSWEPKDQSSTVGFQLLSKIVCSQADKHINFADRTFLESLEAFLPKEEEEEETAEQTRRTWILHLDDHQMAPGAVRAILRAARDWNDPKCSYTEDDPERSTPTANVRVIVLLTGTTSHKVRAPDIGVGAATGLQPYRVTVTLMTDEDAMAGLLDSAWGTAPPGRFWLLRCFPNTKGWASESA
jgi:hypothetical protein